MAETITSMESDGALPVTSGMRVCKMSGVGV